jgi:hypothetical protein
VAIAVASALLGLVYALVMLTAALQPPLGDYVRPHLAALWLRVAGPAPADRAET